MKSGDIRDLFIKMLEDDGHLIVNSSPLIPDKELGLLFTNAGMNQFSKYFEGVKPPQTRLGGVQRCMRVSGKHNDFENVGYSDYHHTFFEMLGFFSFGDYFKEHAIKIGWKYFNEIIKIPDNHLLISIYKDDEESYEIWKKIGIDTKKIYRMDKDNFWEMAETGPCGPSTEIFYDIRGNTIPDIRELSDNTKYFELGNIVFTQYNRAKNGELSDLPQKNVDTGFGFERIVKVLQNCKSNYETDLFMPIIKQVELDSGIRYEGEFKPSFRIIADHIRALSYLIADGVLPSNTGRGYVVRKLLRRAALNVKKLQLETPYLYKLPYIVKNIMSGIYPVLDEKKDLVESIIKEEESRFEKMLTSGYKRYVQIKDETIKNQNDTIDGISLFELYDTYGFPVDLVKDIAKNDKLSIDMKSFYEEMRKQKEKSRSSQKKTFDLPAGIKESIFTGYENTLDKANIIFLMSDKGPVEALSQGEKGIVILDRTPFYPESGGQIGDIGTLLYDGVLFEVTDTQKEKNVHLHYGKVQNGTIKVNTDVTAKVDEKRRKSIQINHTLTHILHSALREILGDHVHQAGSLVSDEILRFDFTHFKKMTDEEIERVEEFVNNAIKGSYEVKTEHTDLEDAIQRGAMALFEAKYDKGVRVIEIPGLSMELCGGIHIENTACAQAFKIISESSISAGIRRIEAISSDIYFKYMNDAYKKITQLKQRLKSDNPINEIERILSDLIKIEKQKKEIETRYIELALRDETIKGENPVILKLSDDIEPDPVKTVLDCFRTEFKDKVILVYQTGKDKIAFFISAGNESNVDLVSFIKPLFPVFKGGGGGRREFIQCGGVFPQGMEKVIGELKKIV